jgi:hypothetical protein
MHLPIYNIILREHFVIVARFDNICKLLPKSVLTILGLGDVL